MAGPIVRHGCDLDNYDQTLSFPSVAIPRLMITHIKRKEHKWQRNTIPLLTQSTNPTSENILRASFNEPSFQREGKVAHPSHHLTANHLAHFATLNMDMPCQAQRACSKLSNMVNRLCLG